VNAAPADEATVEPTEHPDSEAVVPPVGELPLEKLACLLRAHRLRAECGEHAQVAMQCVEIVEIRFG
jgi:hypothetical protein